MKNITDFFTINESNNKFYPEDYENCKNADDVINAITDALYFSDVYKSLAKSTKNVQSFGLNIFIDDKFLKKLGETIMKQVNNAIEEIEDEYSDRY